MDDIVMTQDQIKLNKFATAIDLPQDNPYISYLGEYKCFNIILIM